MTSNDLVSIVLPVWNGERFLKETIESVLGQTYTNWELIIVDDMSSDETPNIISAATLRDSRVKSFRNAENRKLPFSLNRGFSIARGSYFTWISDDNRLLPNFLETMLSEAQNEKIDFIYGDYWAINEKGKRVKLSKMQDLDNLASENCIGASFLYTSEIASVIGGYDEKKFLYEDYDYWVRSRLAGFKFGKSNSVLYEYRIHDMQLSNTRRLPEEFFEYRLSLPTRFLNSGIAFNQSKTVTTLILLMLRNKRYLMVLKCLKLLELKNVHQLVLEIVKRFLRKYKSP